MLSVRLQEPQRSAGPHGGRGSGHIWTQPLVAVQEGCVTDEHGFINAVTWWRTGGGMRVKLSLLQM